MLTVGQCDVGGYPEKQILLMARGKSILVVESEKEVVEVLRKSLLREDYNVQVACDGQTAITEAQRHMPDVILLDRAVSRISADEVAIRLRGDPRLAHVPIIMLSAKTEETDELIAFALGADDYIRKPLSVKVLLARIAAVLRRSRIAGEPANVLQSGPITLDRSRHELRVKGKIVSVTATEFRLLTALIAARGRVLDREQLIDAALGFGVAVTDRTIDVHLVSLRRKLGSAAGCIQTIRGFGYAFRPEPSEQSDDPRGFG